MKLIEKSIDLAELHMMSENMFGNLVKAVVDVDQSFMVIDVNMHADGEAFLLERGSKQKNLWGIKLYPTKFGTNEFIEFDSMINIRPGENNRTRGVEDESIRKKIISIVTRLVTR